MTQLEPPIDLQPAGYDEDDDEVSYESQARRFLDPVHDYVLLEPRVAAFVDTKQFQRLRYLKQLGTAYFIFPGGSHNRFEHCLGVAHLARLMVDSLRRRQPKLQITDRDVFCVQVAGLMHDLGHGPFSHVFDNQFISRVRPERKWCHEEGSEMMFDALIRDNPQLQIPQDEINFVKDLIRGRPLLSSGEKPYLFQIVANAENGLDVDKLDYIARDALNCGVKHGVTTSRIIDTCRVVGDNIVFPYKDHFNVFQVYHTRYALHKQVYNHKTGKAIEYMVVDALIAANPVLRLSDKIDNPDEYLYLTDSVLEEIERSTDPGLATSRAIIDRIRKRDLYKIVDFKVVPSDYKLAWEQTLSVENIVQEAHDIARSSLGSDGSEYLALKTEDVIVDFSALHMGMKDRNPMDLVRFYSKTAPNKSFVARADESMNLLPEAFQEVHIAVFTRDANKRHVTQKAFRRLMDKLPDLVEHEAEPSHDRDGDFNFTESIPSSSQASSTSVESTGTSTTLSQNPSSLPPPSVPTTPLTRVRSLNVSPMGSAGGYSAGGGGSGSPGSILRRTSRSFSAKEQNQFMTLPDTPTTVRKKRARDEDGDVEMAGTSHTDGDGSPRVKGAQPPKTRLRVG